MATVHEHYDQQLGPVYAWMLGGIEAAAERGAAELQALGLTPSSANALAIDLGAGFGMHALPLARSGYHVLAIDSCALLLDALRTRQEDLPVTVVEDDLLAYRDHLSRRPELAVCLGDTLTHLPDRQAVETLIASLAQDLVPGGQFVTTFRDYTTPLTGEQRFIPVKSDDHRILTCFLEYGDTHVKVHDILHEREGDAWAFSISSYPKLRISPAWVGQLLTKHGFSVQQDTTPSRMVRLIARRH